MCRIYVCRYWLLDNMYKFPSIESIFNKSSDNHNNNNNNNNSNNNDLMYNILAPIICRSSNCVHYYEIGDDLSPDVCNETNMRLRM